MEKKIGALLWAMGFLLFLLAGCGGKAVNTAGEAEKTAYEVTDIQGTVTKMPAKPGRIITLSLGTDEIMLGLVEKDRMEYAGVAELADQPLHTLSGGQRQRVLLAKVLAQQTPLLFLDEPAAGLDIFYQEEIFRFCRELCQAGKTVLMVVHELSLAARFCSRLLLMESRTAPCAVYQGGAFALLAQLAGFLAR